VWGAWHSWTYACCGAAGVGDSRWAEPSATASVLLLLEATGLQLGMPAAAAVHWDPAPALPRQKVASAGPQISQRVSCRRARPGGAVLAGYQSLG
jgi:hypothetical protein